MTVERLSCTSVLQNGVINHCFCNSNEDFGLLVTERPAGNSREGTGESVRVLRRRHSGPERTQVCDSIKKESHM